MKAARQSPATVLVADGDLCLVSSVAEALQVAGFTTESVADRGKALQRLARHAYAVVVSTFRFNLQNESFAQVILADRPNASRLAACAAGRLDLVVMDLAPLALAALVETVRRLSAASRPLAPRAEEMIGTSPAVQELRQLIATLGPVESPILIQGETGTGKELVARALVAASARGAAPYQGRNCAAMPEPLLESELFGHMRGSFTDAKDHKAGLLETLDGGTVLLDEVNSMPVGIQAKLLRFLQEHEINRVGSNVTRRVDVRVLAASNSPLHALVERGIFREDLFYRLSVFTIEVPPLRARREDIPLLARHFLERVAARHGRGQEALTDAVLAQLQEYSWPGNIRQLQSAIERLVVLGRLDLQTSAQLQPGRLPECARCGLNLGSAPGNGEAADEVRPLQDVVRAWERSYLSRAVRHHGVAEAARRLRISQSSLYRKLPRAGQIALEAAA